MLLLQAQLPGLQRDFFLRVSFQRRLSYTTVFIQPPRAITCINICAQVKNPECWQPYRCLDARKYSTHQVNTCRWILSAQRAGGIENSCICSLSLHTYTHTHTHTRAHTHTHTHTRTHTNRHTASIKRRMQKKWNLLFVYLYTLLSRVAIDSSSQNRSNFLRIRCPQIILVMYF